MSPLSDIGHVIQLAIAPVFMLTAIGTVLNVLAARLGRAVDRRRVLVATLPTLTGDVAAIAQLEIDFEVRRIRIIFHAMTASVVSAVLVCALISLAFVDPFVGMDLAKPVAALFILSMLALLASLIIFLREILLSLNSPRAPVL